MQGVVGRVPRYVSVVVRFSEEGAITPLEVEWRDGRKFTVDEVADCRRGASMKTGRRGMRYTVRIGAHWTELWLDERGRWFVEEKVLEMPTTA